MKMPNSLKRKLKNGMIGGLSKENLILGIKSYCIGLVSDSLQGNYSRNGKDHMLSRRCIVQEQSKLALSKAMPRKW
jgi:hypothetical protein